MTVCQACGAAARPSDHYCRRCGQQLSSDPSGGPITDLYLAHERWRDVGGAAFRRYFKPIAVLAAIGSIVALSALSGGGNAPVAQTTGPAPPAEVSGADGSEATDRADTSSNPPPSHSKPKPAQEAVSGANGKTYWCNVVTSAALDAIDGDIERSRKRNRRLHRQIKAIERQHPDGTAPGDVVDRFNTLVDTYNSNLRSDRKLVASYNAKLKADCTPD